MAYSVVIENAERRASLTLAGSVRRGDLLAYSSGWVQADCNLAAGPLYAQYVALNAGRSGDSIKGCKSCVIYDEDGLHTADSPLYCSGTVGEVTTTRPSTAGDCVQVVGRSIDAKRSKIDLEAPKEIEVQAQFVTQGGAEAKTALDGGLFYGDQLNAGTEASYYLLRIPENAIGITAAKMLCAVESDINFDYTISVREALHDDQWDANTADSATANTVNATPDDLYHLDVSGAFTWATIGEAGGYLGVQFLRDTAGVDAMLAIGLFVTFLCV